MTKPKRKERFGALLLQAAREGLAYHRGELSDMRVTYARVTTRDVEVVPPPVYREKDVRRVRYQLGLSQAVFAKLLGASAATVRAWERGAREPSDMARRLMALAEREPKVFEQDLVAPSTPNGRRRSGESRRHSHQN